MLPERRDEGVAARTSLPTPFDEQCLALAEQVGDDELLEDRGAEVEAVAGLDDGLRAALGGPHPADAQAAPPRLAGAAEGVGPA